MYDSTEVGPLPVLLFGAGDVGSSGALMACAVGGKALAGTEREAAEREVKSCQNLLLRMPGGADKELLQDKLNSLEQQLKLGQ